MHTKYLRFVPILSLLLSACTARGALRKDLSMPAQTDKIKARVVLVEPDPPAPVEFSTWHNHKALIALQPGVSNAVKSMLSSLFENFSTAVPGKEPADANLIARYSIKDTDLTLALAEPGAPPQFVLTRKYMRSSARENGFFGFFQFIPPLYIFMPIAASSLVVDARTKIEKGLAESLTEMSAELAREVPAHLAGRAAFNKALAKADAAAQAGRKTEALQLYAKAMELTRPRGPEDLLVRQKAATLAAGMSSLPPVPEEAENFSVRAQTRLKMEGANFAEAAEEMTKAIRLAPWWADGYYNMGLMAASERQYIAAVNNLKLYLKLSPGSEDAEAVKKKIVELELLGEEESKSQGLAGRWRSGEGGLYALSFQDGQVKLSPTDGARAHFTLDKKGSALEGTVSLNAYRYDYCDIPGEVNPATGKISADGRSIELSYEVSHYNTSKRWVGISMGSYQCTGVVFLQKNPATTTFTKS